MKQFLMVFCYTHRSEPYQVIISKEFEQLGHDLYRQKQKRICSPWRAGCFLHSSPVQDPVYETVPPTLTLDIPASIKNQSDPSKTSPAN